MKKNIKLIILCLFLTQAISGYATWKWTKIHTLDNGKRFEATGFTANGKGYVTCGVDTNDNCYNDLWEYDPNFDFWTQKANFPAVARRGCFAFELNNKGYVGGGINHAIKSLGTILNDLWVYDPTLNTWTSKASAPTSVFRAAFASCNGKGYLIAGADSWAAINTVCEYNPTNDSWTYKTSFPGLVSSSGGRDGGVATSINNKIYFGMGKDDSFYQNDWWEYNPTTDVWTQKQNYPATGKTGAFAFVVNNNICAGMGSDGSYGSDTWLYNPNTNAWSYCTTFGGAGRRNPAYFVIGDVAYMGTGKSGGGSKQDFYKLEATIGVNEFSEQNQYVTIYPNPISGKEFSVLLEQPLSNINVQITTIDGKLIKTTTLDYSEQTIDVNGIKSGVYFVILYQNKKHIATKKIVLL